MNYKKIENFIFIFNNKYLNFINIIPSQNVIKRIVQHADR